MSTQTNPFAEWSSSSQESPPSVLGALPSISVAPSLPISISDGLVLQFAPDVLNCIVRGPHSRSMFIISSDAQTATFRTNEKQIFALVRFEPLALVEIPGCTPRQRVRDWLRLSSDNSRRHMSVGTMKCVWIPLQQHIVLLAEDSSILARITGSTTAALEVTRLGIQLNLLHPCIVATTLFLSGRHID